MAGSGVKSFLKTAAAAAAACLVAAFLFVMYFSAFTGGEKCYYLYSASSQAETKEALTFGELFFVRGESRVYRLEEGEDAFAFAESIAEKYGAELVFEESAGGTVSRYYASAALKGGIVLNGKLVNLHIAVRNASVAVGTPVIFGGW